MNASRWLKATFGLYGVLFILVLTFLPFDAPAWQKFLILATAFAFGYAAYKFGRTDTRE